jgi:hypothetical protein
LRPCLWSHRQYLLHHCMLFCCRRNNMLTVLFTSNGSFTVACLYTAVTLQWVYMSKYYNKFIKIYCRWLNHRRKNDLLHGEEKELLGDLTEAQMVQKFLIALKIQRSVNGRIWTTSWKETDPLNVALPYVFNINARIIFQSTSTPVHQPVPLKLSGYSESSGCHVLSIITHG